MPDSLIGQKIGQYEIVAQIGQGGMAAVYKAYQPSISRYVAVKVLSKELLNEASFVERFRGEATGPQGPVMGFGRLWCYNSHVQAVLGDPLAPEAAGNNATIETYQGGVLFSLPAEDQIWILYNDGNWQVVGNSP